MKNALSIDLEFWYSPQYVRGYTSIPEDDQIREATGPLLNLFERYKTRVTFFVLGEVAERHPDLIREIRDRGHEIACHGYSHQTLHDLGKKGFEEDLKKSTSLIRSILKERPIGFRAPSFSLNRNTAWALNILERYGYKYDSSIFPLKTPLYGMPGAPLGPYYPSMDDPSKESHMGEIKEFPISVLKVSRIKIPVGGGFYLRVLPALFIKAALETINKDRSGVIYLHPWETYPETPVLDLPLLKKFVTYWGIKSTMKKLEYLVRNIDFCPMEELL